MSGFGPKAARLAGRIGDGFCTMMPDASLVRSFRDHGGGDKPVQAGLKVCWADSEQQGRRTAHWLWRNELLPGAQPQTLSTPREFRSATSLVTEDMVGQAFPCGPDAQRILDRIGAFDEAGFDELNLQQIGPEQEEFFESWQQHVRPHL